MVLPSPYIKKYDHYVAIDKNDRLFRTNDKNDRLLRTNDNNRLRMVQMKGDCLRNLLTTSMIIHWRITRAKFMKLMGTLDLKEQG